MEEDEEAEDASEVGSPATSASLAPEPTAKEAAQTAQEPLRTSDEDTNDEDRSLHEATARLTVSTQKDPVRQGGGPMKDG